jgi:hypothetical protein
VVCGTTKIIVKINNIKECIFFILLSPLLW